MNTSTPRLVIAAAAVTGILALPAQALATVTALLEDFESAAATYTLDTSLGPVGDQLQRAAAGDYFGRITPAVALPSGLHYTNAQGAGYFGIQDSDGTGAGNIDRVTLTWTGIDVRGLTRLALSFLLAEDVASDGRNDWDANTRLRVAVRHDNGMWVDVFGVAAARNPADPADRTNEVAAVDTNLDGIGDGPRITEAFTRHVVMLPSASGLDLRFTFANLDAGDEDLALDQVLLQGVAIPAPAARALVWTVLLLFAWLHARRVSGVGISLRPCCRGPRCWRQPA